MCAGQEETLTGGVVNTVVRVGSTVRRSTGPWTPAVHALLDHLESAGFPYSPRVLGIDEHGREILTYIEGVPGLRPWPPAVRSDAALVAVGRMLGSLTEALRTFTPPANAVWRTTAAGPSLPGGSFRHGDVGLWNTIWSGDQGDRLAALIDWDFAEPAPPLWDLAQAAWYGIPLFRGEEGWRSCGFDTEPDYRHRLALLCDAYGAGAGPGLVLDALADLQAVERERITTLGAAGIAPFADFLARGDLDELDAEAAWLRSRRSSLLSG